MMTGSVVCYSTDEVKNLSENQHLDFAPGCLNLFAIGRRGFAPALNDYFGRPCGPTVPHTQVLNDSPISVPAESRSVTIQSNTIEVELVLQLTVGFGSRIDFGDLSGTSPTRVLPSLEGKILRR